MTCPTQLLGTFPVEVPVIQSTRAHAAFWDLNSWWSSKKEQLDPKHPKHLHEYGFSFFVVCPWTLKATGTTLHNSFVLLLSKTRRWLQCLHSDLLLRIWNELLETVLRIEEFYNNFSVNPGCVSTSANPLRWATLSPHMLFPHEACVSDLVTSPAHNNRVLVLRSHKNWME